MARYNYHLNLAKFKVALDVYSYKFVFASLQDSVKHQMEKAENQKNNLKREEKLQDGVRICP